MKEKIEIKNNFSTQQNSYMNICFKIMSSVNDILIETDFFMKQIPSLISDFIDFQVMIDHTYLIINVYASLGKGR